MKLPTWEELIGEQLTVMEYRLDRALFVAGPPGSGKTTLAVKRAILAAGKDASVVLVTYNRMLRRLSSLLSEGAARSSTMHSFAFSDYWTRTGDTPASAGPSSYDYDWEKMLCTLAGGLEDKPRWNHAIVDEGQDLPQNFFRYLHEHAATVLTVFADEDQALGDRRTTLTEIAVGGNLPKPDTSACKSSKQAGNRGLGGTFPQWRTPRGNASAPAYRTTPTTHQEGFYW